MRTCGIALLLLLAGDLFAAAPPAPMPHDLSRLIRLLSDPDHAIRRRAMALLEQRDDRILPELRAAALAAVDVDVRLRLNVIARAIRSRGWGLVKAFGPGAPITVRPHGDGYWLNRVQFSPDGRFAVATGGGLILYDLASGKETGRTLEVNYARLGLCVARDGKHVLTGHATVSTFHLVAMPTLRVQTTFTGHTGGIYDVNLSASGTRAVSVSQDGSVRLWDTSNGKELLRIAGFSEPPFRAVFSPDGRRVLIGLSRGLIVLVDAATGQRRQTIRGHTDRITGAAWRPDGKTIVTTSVDGTLRSWEVATGKELFVLRHGSHINDLALSPDGNRALTAGFLDRQVKAWDLRRGGLLESFDGHVGGVLGVAFSPDGKQALSCDSICTLRLWKVGR